MSGQQKTSLVQSEVRSNRNKAKEVFCMPEYSQEEVPQAVGRQFVSFVSPLLWQLDAVLDRRLVR
jgi:hypothetical protein